MEPNRGKVTDTYYMGHQSLSRQRFHSQRRDLQGKNYYQERQGRNDSRGRQYYRRYYRGDSRGPRDFLRDARSVSRQRMFSREGRGRSESRRDDGRNDGRNGSRDRSKEVFKKCIACRCENCLKLRKNAEELRVNLCEGYEMNEEILVNYTEKGRQVMTLDIGAPVSLAGKELMVQYLREH